MESRVIDSVHRFEVVGENGRVVAYTSIIDNQTSDGSYMLGQLPAGGLEFSWLPGAAKISGANNSLWRSDVIVMHVGGSADSTDFGFFPPGANLSGSIDTASVVIGSRMRVRSKRTSSGISSATSRRKRAASGRLRLSPPVVSSGCAPTPSNR